jgi:murein L,D-transpeptidase YafK
MKIIRAVLILAVCAIVASCAAPPSKFKTYDGPEVTRILVYKESRRMYLMHHDVALKAYNIDLGFNPVGPKELEGDGRTPEGDFFIDRRNPNSSFHLSLGISYPQPHHKAAARELGANAGGDIFIHGGPRRGIDRNGPDWTAGCIAVTNEEMEDIYAMVRIGTPISIYP